MEDSFNHYIDTDGQEQNARGAFVLATDSRHQSDPAQELHGSRWAAFRNPSDQVADFDSYPSYPSPSSFHSQISPQSRAHSWNGSTDVGGMWDLEDPGTAGHLGSWGGSASPSTQTSLNQAQLPNDWVWTQASDAQSSFLATSRPTFSWSVTGNPSETRTHIHAPVAMSRKGSLNPELIENSVRQPRKIPEVDLRSAALVSTEERLPRPLPGQSSLRHGLSVNTNATESPSPTQSTTSDPGGTEFPSFSGGKRKKPRRKAHNAIERRYRSRLNEKIAGLRDSIPSLRAKVRSEVAPQGGSFDPTESSSAALKVNKADVLEKATEYVKHLEKANRQLKAQLQQALSLSREGSLRNSPPSNYHFAGPRQELRPLLKSDNRSQRWHLQDSGQGTFDYELLQYGSSKPETEGNPPIIEPSECQVSQGDISYSRFPHSP